MKRALLVGGISIFLTALVGAAGFTALAGGGDKQSGRSDDAAERADDAGIHGGSIERFHVAGGCELTAINGLPGNWTHGDYVSAVAALGDSALIVEAAHSDCGKPMQSVGHGGGTSAHALEHAAKGLEKAEKAKEAAEKSDEAKEGSSGS